MHATQILDHAVASAPRRVATVFGDRQRSWSEVGRRVPRMAGALRALGLASGDRVAALAMNSDRYLELFFAVPWAGGVFAPLNIRWSVAENVYALTDSTARILFVGTEFVEDARRIQAARPGVSTLIYMGEGETPPGMLSFEQLIDAHEPVEDALRRDEDLYVIFYTGGTTAHPKGVAMSHRAVVFGAVSYLAMLPNVEDLSHLGVGGYFHFSGASALWYITLAAGRHVILPKFEPVAVMQAIGAHRVTNTNTVPTMIAMLMNHPDFGRHRLDSLQTCIYGGSPMPEAVMHRAMQLLPTWKFYQIYGMTETGGFATILRWRDHAGTGGRPPRLRSAGQPAPGVALRVVAEGGRTAAPGELGEIVVAGAMMMSGYLNDPEATALALRNGWMHTGDAGFLDEDGFLYVADRVKDMIVSGGENVYSVEVERALHMHPAVREAAVFGIPSERWGEAVHAVVVPHPSAPVSEAELVAHCRTLIGGYKVPRSIELRQEPLPLTPVGKVRKNVLKEPYWRGLAERI